jgi:leucine dehydrogenase
LGDPSPVTAWGVFQGIRACLEVVYGSPEVAGRTIAIQGVGNVGYHLARYAHNEGAKLLFTDISERKLRRVVEEFNGTVIEEEAFYGTECDVLAPCAIGGILNARTIPKIRAPIIAGGANNQLNNEEEDGALIESSGITYAPDYVINAGGLIHVSAELKGFPEEKAMSDSSLIFDTVKRVINKAKAQGITTTKASNQVAEERMDQVARLRRLHLPSKSF